MSPDDFGTVSLFYSVLMFVSVVGTLNLSWDGVNNSLLDHPEDRSGVVSALQTLTTLLTLGVWGIYVLLGSPMNDELGFSGALVAAMFLQIVVTPAYELWAARERFELRYRGVFAVAISSSVLVPLIGVAAVRSSDADVEARVYSALMVYVVMFGVIYVRNVWLGRRIISVRYWLESLRLNVPLVPHYLSRNVLNQFDRVLIAGFFGVREVAIYSLAYSVGILLNLVTVAVNASLLPWSYRRLRAGRGGDVGRVGVQVYCAMGFLTVLLVGLTPEIVALLGPSEYRDARWVVPPVALGALYLSASTLFTNVQLYNRASSRVGIVSIVAASVNLGLNLLLLPVFGYFIAGVVTMLSYAVMAGGQYLVLRLASAGRAGESVYSGRAILGISGLATLGSGLMVLIFDYLVVRVGLLLVATTVAAFVAIRSGRSALDR